MIYMVTIPGSFGLITIMTNIIIYLLVAEYYYAQNMQPMVSSIAY